MTTPVRFKVDENLPKEVADLLRANGYDALTVLEQRLGGTQDIGLAQICQRERRALVTLDVDFADIRRYPPADYLGLIVLRLVRQDKPRVLESCRRLLPALDREPLERRLWIVEEAQIRVRE